MQAYAVSGISPAATSLRSWTAPGLIVLHEAFLRCRASLYETAFFESTSAGAMNRRSPEIFKKLFEELPDRTMELAAHHKFKFNNPLHVIDSTIIAQFPCLFKKLHPETLPQMSQQGRSGAILHWHREAFPIQKRPFHRTFRGNLLTR